MSTNAHLTTVVCRCRLKQTLKVNRRLGVSYPAHQDHQWQQRYMYIIIITYTSLNTLTIIFKQWLSEWMCNCAVQMTLMTITAVGVPKKKSFLTTWVIVKRERQSTMRNGFGEIETGGMRCCCCCCDRRSAGDGCCCVAALTVGDSIRSRI